MCPETEVIDAFTQIWGNYLKWLVPPPIKAAITNHKIRYDHEKDTLIIPEWKYAPFWPLIYNINNISLFVKETRYLTDNNIIVKGTGNNGVFVNFPLKFKILTLKIEF